jgi:hypothetical protein
VLALLALALAACGGGSGPGGGGAAAQLKAMVVNLSANDVTLTLPGAPDQKVGYCDFKEVDFPLSVPFQLSVGGKQILDSSTIKGGVPGDGEIDVLTEVTIDKDGAATVTRNPYNGRDLTGPSRLFVNSSCAKPR